MTAPFTNVSESNPTRFRSFDVLKGFIIFAIVMAHLAYSSHSTYGEPALFLQIIYLGLISFFIMSGYFFRSGRGFQKNFMKRAKQLFVALAICTVVLSAILFVWMLLWGQATDFNDYINALIWGFGQSNIFQPFGAEKTFAICAGSMGYYFLWAMLLGFLIFYALADRVMDSNWKVAVVIAVLLVITFVLAEFVRIRLPFYAELAPSAASFMFAGAWLAKMDLGGVIERFEVKTKEFWLPFLFCLIVGLVMCVLLPPDTNYDSLIMGKYGGYSVFPYFFEAVMICVAFFYIAAFIGKIPLLGKALSKVGEHTLGILLLHGFVACMIMAPFWTFTHATWLPTDPTFMVKVGLGFATFLITLAMCMLKPYVISKLDRSKAKE